MSGRMTDELKEWARILRFAMPSVIGLGIASGGFGIALFGDDYESPLSDALLTGLAFAFGGLWYFWRMEVFRLKDEIKKLKKVSE